MKKTKFALAGLLTCAAMLSHAATVQYSGSLTPDIPQIGAAGGFSWFLDEGDGVQFWDFTAHAGDTVTLEVDRLSANFDPGLSLFYGTTSADTSAYTGYADWGGLTYIGSLDDENPAAIASPHGGDPFGSFVVTQTGHYTLVVGGSLSSDAGTYPYSVTMTSVAAAVPEPSSLAMLAMGLGLVALRKRVRED